jgi:hypothetical protein
MALTIQWSAAVVGPMRTTGLSPNPGRLGVDGGEELLLDGSLWPDSGQSSTRFLWISDSRHQKYLILL